VVLDRAPPRLERRDQMVHAHAVHVDAASTGPVCAGHATASRAAWAGLIVRISDTSTTRACLPCGRPGAVYRSRGIRPSSRMIAVTDRRPVPFVIVYAAGSSGDDATRRSRNASVSHSRYTATGSPSAFLAAVFRAR